ncbi:NmrA family NAD(P)-binding protein [Acidisoma silvae]|uniref:NmrA family NAD(P)-binding protein n=1 Tax=Acidisoma silvae TaxID=2802396 RepID=A0A963YX20_9PROT|nr:NmrA family NAD(P)-binding protein [Acidisoma silvae]MCB8877880.1 NmrA family NAD(P)-binding protein [Acidisoma silvae]
MTQTVLLVGATGMLGGRIASHLANDDGARLRLLVRDTTSKKLGKLRDQNVEFVEGDLSDRGSLDRATTGVDVIISAVQGGPDVIVEGQVALAEAGKRNGVRRILPSDFGLDVFKATPGEHTAFNMRAQADGRIAALGLESIHILQGAFLDLFGPGSPMIDYDKGIATFWGDGKMPIEATSVEDTARVTARVALDRTVPAGKFAFYGDRLSFNEAADVAEKVVGKSFERRSLGMETDLRAAMAVADFGTRIMLAYSLYMSNGQTSLDDVQNDRYPDLRLQSFEAFLTTQLG